ncbi:hypothetical protein GQR58_019923 [Nymphon striatum]|nr:hypothetical protein GQR58_019923 [Nymphon striatum]
MVMEQGSESGATLTFMCSSRGQLMLEYIGMTLISPLSVPTLVLWVLISCLWTTTHPSIERKLAVEKIYFRIHTKFQAYPEETYRKYGLIEYMWFNFRSTIYQGYLLCASFYCAVLRAHMTLTTIVAPIHNIHELANHPTILPSIQGLGSHETWLMNSKQKDVKKIWQKVQSNKNGRIYDCFNSRTVVTELNGALLCEKETAIAMLSEDYHTTKNCHMYIIPEPIKTSVLAFMFNKNSSWITLINKQLRKVKEAGLYNLWMRQETAGINYACVGSIEKTIAEKRSFHLQDIYGPFILWGFGLIVSFITICVEIIQDCKCLCCKKCRELKDEG